LHHPVILSGVRRALLANYTEEQIAKLLLGNAERILRMGWGKRHSDRMASDWLEKGSSFENPSTPGRATQECFVPECVRPLFMRAGGLQKRTGVRETVLGRGLWRHRMLPARNLRKMLSPYMAEIQGFTATGRSGLSPDRLERTERFRGKCARIGQKCGGVSPDGARREIAGTPVNTGRK
jgi:hypothetical protein